MRIIIHMMTLIVISLNQMMRLVQITLTGRNPILWSKRVFLKNKAEQCYVQTVAGSQTLLCEHITQIFVFALQRRRFESYETTVGKGKDNIEDKSLAKV